MDAYQIIVYILIVLFGLAAGSFLNVVIYRYDDLSSILRGRSHCPKCKKILPWFDLIPFISYLLLFGRCRACKKTISLQYPLVEGATALIFALIYWQFGFSAESLFLALISSLLIVIAAYDWKHLEIPDVLSYLAIGLVIILDIVLIWQKNGLADGGMWLNYGYGLAIGAGFFGLLVVASRQKWMGAGDILIGALMGVLLGFPGVLFALFFAFLLGSLGSLLLMALKHKTLKDTIAFGPFLIAATFIVLFWGEKIMNVYLVKFGL